MLFTGQYEHAIDAKHRLAIPADIRSRWQALEHGGAWYALPWVGRTIRLYTERDFVDRAKDRRLGLTPDQDEAELQATLFGLSARLEMDTAGRIRLPEDMLDLVGLASDVTLVGAGEWLEIRDRAAWRESRRSRLEKLPELMARIESKESRRKEGS